MQGGELDAPIMRREGKRAALWEGSAPVTRPVDHRLTLDPCGLAYSLLRPHACTPKVVPACGWTTGLPASDRNPQGRDWTREPTIAAPRGLARDETDGAGKSRKGGAGVQARGEGRRQPDAA